METLALKPAICRELSPHGLLHYAFAFGGPSDQFTPRRLRVRNMPPEIIAKDSLHEGWCNLFRVLMRVDGGEIIREVRITGARLRCCPMIRSVERRS